MSPRVLPLRGWVAKRTSWRAHAAEQQELIRLSTLLSTMVWLRLTFLLSALTAIGLLASIAAKASFVDLRIAAAFNQIRLIGHDVQAYEKDAGHLPERLDQLSNGVSDRRRDPWGNDYPYRPGLAGTRHGVYSFGADGKDQRGGGDDVTVPQKAYACSPYGLNCPFSVEAGLAIALALIALITLVTAQSIRWHLGRRRVSGSGAA